MTVLQVLGTPLAQVTVPALPTGAVVVLTAAAGVLLLGAVGAVAPGTNGRRAAVALFTQAVATVLTWFVVGPILAGGSALRATVPWAFPMETMTVHVDALGAFFLAWSLPMTLLGTVYAVGYLRPAFATRNAGGHFALLNVVSFSFLMVYCLENALVFLLGWEIAAVAAWLLVIWDDRNQKVRFAGFNYLVSTHVGLFFLLAAFMIMRSQTGSMDFAGFGRFLAQPGPLRDVTFLLLLVAFGLKSAFFPFHTWLPRAHAAAPAHVSALMSGVIHKAGMFGLLRFLLLTQHPDAWMGWALLAFSLLSAVVGALYTTNQRDLKRLLGYSSTENVGIAGVGFGLATLGLAWGEPALVTAGIAGGVLHLFNHALFKCLLFYAAGAVHHAVHSVDLERLGGLARRLPATAVLFLLGGLAMAGLPPFNGFVSEFILYQGLLASHLPVGLPRVLLVVTGATLGFVGAVGALSITRAFGVAFLGSGRDAGLHPAQGTPPSMVGTMVAHGLGVVLVGMVPATGLWLVRPVLGLFVGGTVASVAGATVTSLEVTVSRVGALGGMLVLMVALLLGLRQLAAGVARRRSHVTWACGYTAVTPRMQYTGHAFSTRLVELFQAVLPTRRRVHPVDGAFPTQAAAYAFHQPDAVEDRLFEVIGGGEALVQAAVGRAPNQDRLAFAAGLAVLSLLAGLLMGGG